MYIQSCLGKIRLCPSDAPFSSTTAVALVMRAAGMLYKMGWYVLVVNPDTWVMTRGPTKSDFRYRYIATKIPYRPGIPSTILYYRSRKYARINIDVYVAELSVSQYKKCMKELATKWLLIWSYLEVFSVKTPKQTSSSSMLMSLI